MSAGRRSTDQTTEIAGWRRWFLLGLLLLGAAGLMSRAVYLQWIDRDFLQNQGDARHLRVMELAANRGVIMDRNREPLAISTPVDSVWVNPQVFLENAGDDEIAKLAKLLAMSTKTVKQRISERSEKEFVYLRRHIAPELASKVKRLGFPGVNLQREYRRFYPTGEVTGHVIGFTNVDDIGQEGIELAYESALQGTKGAKRVLKDSLGNVVESVESISEPDPGEDIVLSIDRRVQYLAYRELKAAVKTYRARSASAVILDTQTGEVLAMVNQPSFNPNDRSSFNSANYRNRAVTDVFEPGSTMKPFTIAAALDSGKLKANAVIDTTPGRFKVGGHTIRDAVNYGPIDVTTVLKKSSNVGTSKIALSITPEELWKTFNGVGFGVDTNSRFPGEADGLIGDYWQWKDGQQAARSYGYGLSVTTLQLARAYSVLANDGYMKPVSFVKQDNKPDGELVLSPSVAKTVRSMLESVVSNEGTGKLAAIDGYRIAGKTGTAHRSSSKGYAEDRYTALFAGIAPASNPRLVMVVVMHDPQSDDYHGGSVAAPVFSKVMSGALRLLNIPPDNLKSANLRHAGIGGDSANAPYISRVSGRGQ